MIKVPKIDWKPFDKNAPPTDLTNNSYYLVLLREDNYDNESTLNFLITCANLI